MPERSKGFLPAEITHPELSHRIEWELTSDIIKVIQTEWKDKQGKVIACIEAYLSKDEEENTILEKLILINPETKKEKSLFEYIGLTQVKCIIKRAPGSYAHFENVFAAFLSEENKEPTDFVIVPPPDTLLDHALLLHEYGHAAQARDPEWRDRNEANTVVLFGKSGLREWADVIQILPKLIKKEIISFPHTQILEEAKKILNELTEASMKLIGELTQHALTETDTDTQRVIENITQLNEEADKRFRVLIAPYYEDFWKAANTYRQRLERDATARAFTWMRKLKKELDIDLFADFPDTPETIMERTLMRNRGQDTLPEAECLPNPKNAQEVLQTALMAYVATSKEMQGRKKRPTQKK